MNNIKKAFKDKSRLRCMADGGFVKDENRSVPRLAAEKEPEIFRSEVGGVPTFTDQYARRPGAVPYTPGQGAQNVPTNTITNNETGATRTVGQNSYGLPVAPAPAMGNTGRELLGMAKQVPVFGPMVAAADAAATALRQSPYEKMNGLAAGSRSTPESNVPSWVRGTSTGGLRPGGLDPSIIANAAKFDQPADTRPMWQRAPKMDIGMTSPVANGQFGNVGQPQTAPAPMWQRQPMQDVGMDYVSKTGGYGPTKKPEPVAQMADGGSVLRTMVSGVPTFTHAPRVPPKTPPPSFKMKKVFKAEGGSVEGPGGPTDDKVPAMLSDGEYVLPADTVKAVGVDKLNALRDATHEPTGKAKYRQGLRRYNDGDPVIDPRKQMVPVGQPGRIEIPGTQRAARAAAQAAAEAPVPTNRAMTPYKAPLSFKSLGGLSRAAGTAGTVLEAYDTVKDTTVPGMTTVDNIARVSEGIGRTAGAGAGALLGSSLGPIGTVVGGIAGYAAPDAVAWAGRKLGVLDDTAELPSARADRLRTENFNRAVADENLRNSTAAMPAPRKYVVGQPQAEQPSATSNSPGLNDIQREALGAARSQLRDRGGGGYYAQVPRSDREINARYDKLGRELRGMYSSKGQGNLARKLLELEAARGRELGFDQRGAIDLAGMNSGANTAANAQRNQARMAAANDLSALGNTQAMTASNSLLAQSRVDAENIAAQAKAASDAAKASAKAVKEGETRYGKIVDSIFGEDAEGADKFRRFVAASDPQFISEQLGTQDLYSLGPAEMTKAVHKLRKLSEMQDVRNAYAGNSLVGHDYGQSTGLDMPVGVREIVGDDFFNGNVGFADWAVPNIVNAVTPFGAPMDETGVVFQSGAVVPRRKVVERGGKTDADKERFLYDAQEARRSRLRPDK